MILHNRKYIYVYVRTYTYKYPDTPPKSETRADFITITQGNGGSKDTASFPQSVQLIERPDGSSSTMSRLLIVFPVVLVVIEETGEDSLQIATMSTKELGVMLSSWEKGTNWNCRWEGEEDGKRK